MQNLLKISTLFLLGMYASSLHSHPVTTLDPDKPIKIQADTASVEQLKQEAIYTGNVIMVQGEHELRADELIIKKDPHGGLNVITAKGNPAHFTGKRLDDPQPLLATANLLLSC
jgi:lipopolysaccharide export system protein LptA